jgi:putative addiction module component (TIGR02574 family)
MGQPAKELLAQALALTEDERLTLATELIASVDGPADADWDAAWLAEIDRRVAASRASDGDPADWNEVRSRILAKLGRE